MRFRIKVVLLLVAIPFLMLLISQELISKSISVVETRAQNASQSQKVIHETPNKLIKDPPSASFVKQTTKPSWISTGTNGHDIYMFDLNTSNPLDLPTPLPFLSDMKNPCFYDQSEALRCLPYFFILAPQKSGTTDIFNLLSKHQEILSPPIKEPHWFDRTRFGGYPPKKVGGAMPLVNYLNKYSIKANQGNSTGK